MHDTLFKIKQIAGLVIFIAVLSTMGMITGRPVMMLAYAAFFLLISVVVYFSLKNNQRHFEVTQRSNKTFRRVLAAILMVLAIVAPLLIALRTSVINLPESLSTGVVVPMMLGLSILFIIMVLATVFLINRKGTTLANRAVGYIVFIIASIIPGVLMSRVDSTTMGIGSVYYVAMAVLILAYNAFGLYFNQE
ncbi:MAG: hypothetical protein WCY87_02830 [Candidatus Cloacimonadales bacterium]|jgi:uncharacterized membrane protein (DUF485 family)|nr:hypothetical protein [Candidatus Cloacimonadota bacterium]MDY0380885.1 hypothetical protein [Candidatus Cloacimonadaceae bacterium]HCM16268.1 hypothetical protein [Candidatus Cloacimonas sp.]MCB5256350.1 hypothetical protein [Candidatus Cloacimonadota bacterium]MCB5263478.1 hypothetical protein [Candidatus Cloacimonadota bacterium]